MKRMIEVKDKESNVYYKMNPKYFDEIIELFNESSNTFIFKKKLNTTHIHLAKWIDKVLYVLSNSFYTIQTKIFWIVNGLVDFPKCKNFECNKQFNDMNVKSIVKGYQLYCSHKCAVNDPVIKEKTKNTCLNKYGTVSPAQNEDVKAKSRKTCKEKYGVEYSFQSNNNKEKSKQTCLVRYGVEHASTSKEIIEKTENTKKDKYGECQPWHSKGSMEKRRSTWMKNYGVDHPAKSDVIQKKMKNTLVSNYGVDHFSKSSEFRLERAKLSYENIIMKNEYDVPLFSLEEYAARADYHDELEFKCKKCGNTFKAVHCNGHHARCPDCYPVEKSFSLEEKEVVEFLKEFYKKEIYENTRKIISPLELDIYVPDRKIAIEFNGLFWHSADQIHDKNYHMLKTQLCEKQNIQLIHIFENEWIYKKAIVKSRLRSLFGVFDKVVFARKCTVKVISPETSYQFQEENHIQGAVKAKIHLGLYFNDDLIALMTFGRPRFNKKYEWELLRFCCKLSYHIPGGAGKLLKYFENTCKPKSLISYADRRWSTGKMYKSLGFFLDHISKPDYWYFKLNAFILESRIKYQKHKLKDIFENFDETKTEVENMKANGYHRIFDCGNLVFVKTY